MTVSEKRSIQEKKKRKRTELLFNQKYGKWFVGLLLFALIYRFFIEPLTIGTDSRYTYYIFLLPVITGLLVTGVYRRHFLIKTLSIERSFVFRGFIICFYLIQGTIFSYITFGQLTKMTWDLINYRVSLQNSLEEFRCDLTGFTRRRGPDAINFKFQGSSEHFYVRYRTIKNYVNMDPVALELDIKGQKGLWDCYLVKSWRIVKK